ncbi:MAG TPA: hypothetical protein VK911_00375 [Vicinamibacterales bacterium]|nr:hypothetical protein [Vicinamibacterales bacterium]
MPAWVSPMVGSMAAVKAMVPIRSVKPPAKADRRVGLHVDEVAAQVAAPQGSPVQSDSPPSWAFGGIPGERPLGAETLVDPS